MREELRPRLEEARGGKRSVFFVDAAHFVHGAFLGYVWAAVRFFLPTPSGRKRYNVLGALNAVTRDLIRVVNDTTIGASAVVELLRLVTRSAAGPVTVVLDNARYQKCELVRSEAKRLKVELLYLPTYSPNLNLIERVWRFVKKQSLVCRYHETFADFRGAISRCLGDLNDRYRHEMKSLLTWNFQTFHDVPVLPA